MNIAQMHWIYISRLQFETEFVFLVTAKATLTDGQEVDVKLARFAAFELAYEYAAWQATGRGVPLMVLPSADPTPIPPVPAIEAEGAPGGQEVDQHYALSTAGQVADVLPRRRQDEAA